MWKIGKPKAFRVSLAMCQASVGIAVFVYINYGALAQARLVTSVLAAVFVTRIEAKWFGRRLIQGGTVSQCKTKS